jgi:hypothetical protein
MGTLIGFAVGYIFGTRAGREGFEQVAVALRDIRRSEAFTGLVGALTGHLEHILHEVNDRLVGESGQIDRPL